MYIRRTNDALPFKRDVSWWILWCLLIGVRSYETLLSSSPRWFLYNSLEINFYGLSLILLFKVFLQPLQFLVFQGKHVSHQVSPLFPIGSCWSCWFIGLRTHEVIGFLGVLFVGMRAHHYVFTHIFGCNTAMWLILSTEDSMFALASTSSSTRTEQCVLSVPWHSRFWDWGSSSESPSQRSKQVTWATTFTILRPWFPLV